MNPNEEERRIVCMSAATSPHVESTMVSCGDCGAPLWRSNASLHQDMTPICFDCVPADGTKPGASMVQIKELAEAWGITALEVANFLSIMGIEIVDD